MEKKALLLSDLKKQVMILKTQLENVDKSKARHNNHNQSSSSINRSALCQSSRFNDRSYDSTYLDKGVKKFALKENHRFKNLAQLISSKSKVEERPRLSQYRMAEGERTKQNFSTQKSTSLTPRSRTPNPLTGEGYTERQKGIKTRFDSKNKQNFFNDFKSRDSQSKRTERGSKRHFPVIMYR